MNKKEKIKVLIDGSYPPPYGGVGVFVRDLLSSPVKDHFDLLFLRTASRTSEKKHLIMKLAREIRDAFSLFHYLFKDRDIKIVHIHTSSYLGFWRYSIHVLISKMFGKPVILHMHGGEFDKFYNMHNKIGKTYIRKIFDVADKLIVVSRKWKVSFSTIALSSKIMIIPNGYNQNLFRDYKIDPNKKLGLPSDKKILLNIADLELHKGQKYLIKAMRKVLAKRGDVMLYIVGQGSLKKSLQSLIKDYGLENNIVLVRGNKPRKEIPLWMNTCDVFVLPSLAEGNPTVMFEALGCGKPFVGTRVGGIPEVITNEKLGILVEPKDVDGLAKAILKALDKEWNKEHILNYAKQFTWDKIAEKIMEVYDGVLRQESH